MNLVQIIILCLAFLCLILAFEAWIETVFNRIAKRKEQRIPIIPLRDTWKHKND